MERKIGHLMRRRHGGQRARVRGQTKVAADLSLLAAAVNLARFGVPDYTSNRAPVGGSYQLNGSGSNPGTQDRPNWGR